jgi:endonuclease G
MADATAPEQARAAAASCTAELSGKADDLAPTGGPAELVRVTRWGERFAFDPRRGTTLWAAHLLTAVDQDARAAAGLVRGDRRFSSDPALRESPRPEDYRGTGYDRGHLQPAGDAADMRALDESFLMGNVVPQDHAMNERPWEFLESSLRDLVTATHGRAVVVTGALFLGADGQQLQPGTETRLPGGRAGVPTHIFKTFLLRVEGQPAAVAAYLCPNSFAGRGRPDQVEYLRKCAVPLAELARVSGLRFFGGATGTTPKVPAGYRGLASTLWPAGS